MDSILFLAIWLGGALLHTLYELRVWNGSESDDQRKTWRDLDA